MNRFKFRVWDDAHGETNKKFWFSDDMVEFWTWIENNHIPEKNIQQFTGLFDINGKEIFEGDIVSFFFFTRDESGTIHENPIESKAVVKYKEDSAEFVLEIFGVKGSGWSFGMLMTFVNIESEEWRTNERINKLKLTIIGNIFENPDLIKKHETN